MTASATQYEVRLYLNAGGFQLLQYRNRIAWNKRTAEKHCADMNAQFRQAPSKYAKATVHEA
ncbi:hypothetical protein [uncultured Deefgea sp.]|uniref:hypothetical protein n=1 Tax=uncultured Deefgea sp. TaxID=1304914 RepID=UPI00262265BC|nr:hypothetical protein [uncultured Deefgea sp.]